MRQAFQEVVAGERSTDTAPSYLGHMKYINSYNLIKKVFKTTGWSYHDDDCFRTTTQDTKKPSNLTAADFTQWGAERNELRTRNDTHSHSSVVLVVVIGTEVDVATVEVQIAAVVVAVHSTRPIVCVPIR